MHNNKAIVVSIVLFNHRGYVKLVLQVNTGRVNEILKLVHFEPNTIVERTYWSDQSLLITALPLADLLIVKRLGLL